MRHGRRRGFVLLLLLAVPAIQGVPASDARRLPYRVTEIREPCADWDRLRRPFFGDLHVHTSFSFDAQINGNDLNDPTDAYEFAKGMEKEVPFGDRTRTVQLRRPLDFAAVTDHSEYFGETRICATPGTPGYESIHCRTFRGEGDAPGGLSAFQFWGLNLIETLPESTACRPAGACEVASDSVWNDIRAAAEAAYDRTAACSFTSFVAYEYTGSTGGFNGHRNVIFRNESVPAHPTTSFETGGTNAPALWQALFRDCIDALPGCDVLAIPHNSNISGGVMFPEPTSIQDAAARIVFEPLVEISQIKGASECRFDRLAGRGAGTEDELCAWENRPPQMQSEVPGVPYVVPIDEFPQSNMVRNALKSGLAIQQRLGVNPFKLGFVGGTDTHNGTPGAVEEDERAGTHGDEDDTPRERISGRHIYENPGALAVVWAEENSRDALFEAMRRRETYATSGTRPVVRFFGGWKLNPNHCRKRAQLRRAYAVGVPMGSDLPKRVRKKRPRFYISAVKDPGTEGHPGTDLQRIQIVKGWLDASGTTHEQVVDVVGDSTNGAWVTPSCEPTGQGARELCTVWEDEDFDASQQAFYYARVLENPTCRWHTRVCQDMGLNPLLPGCRVEAAARVRTNPGTEWANCCFDERTDPFITPVTQERAWTSPIWYRPKEPRPARPAR
jgi:hypothetical protein